MGVRNPESCKRGRDDAHAGGHMSEGAGQGPVIGIDVAKAELEVAVRPSGDRWTATNEAGGIRELVARLTTLGPELIVLEATGGYELAVVGALATAGLRRWW
jgi:hypothetical protein